MKRLGCRAARLTSMVIADQYGFAPAFIITRFPLFLRCLLSGYITAKPIEDAKTAIHSFPKADLEQLVSKFLRIVPLAPLLYLRRWYEPICQVTSAVGHATHVQPSGEWPSLRYLGVVRELVIQL